MQSEVVLLPGLHGSIALFESFTALAPPWARCHPVALPDSGEQTFDALAAQLIGRLRGLSQFVLFAESFSAPIASRLAADLREQVALVVLCNPLVEAPVVLEPAFLSAATRLPLVPEIAVAMLMCGGNRALSRRVVREVRKLPSKVFKERIACAYTADRRELVAALAAPLLVIGGTGDRLLPPNLAESLANEVPFAVYAAVPAPHLAAQVAPAQVWAAITEEFERAA